MPVDDLIESFRDEHRKMRDILLGLDAAFQTSDHEAIRDGIEEMEAHAAPHFLFEQQALYPALAEIYGDGYVDKLIDEHALAIAAAQELSELARMDEIDEQAAEYGAELVRQLLPHIAERDGISVILEVLPPDQIEGIRREQDRSRAAGAKLSDLARRATARKRTAKPRKRKSMAAGAKTKPAVKRKAAAKSAPKKKARKR